MKMENSRHMTLRQKLLKQFYPALIWANRITGRRSVVKKNEGLVLPQKSIYALSVKLNDGSVLEMEKFRGNKLLIVNTASNCGYTAQYKELQTLYERYKGSLAVIAFPANDFKDQEKGNDMEIASFCRSEFGVRFPVASKSSVKKNQNQNKIFTWLTNKTWNGWNDREPNWNFSKYLVNEEGILTHYFDPGISPLGVEITEALHL